MIIDPARLSEYSSYELLQEANRGALGIDRRWLHALIDQPDKTLEGIVRYASEVREDERVPLDADLISIFHFLRTPLGLPYLISLIRQQPEDVEDEVAEAIVAIGAPAIEPLLALHEELGPGDSDGVAFLLAGLGVHDPRILDLLLKRLDQDLSEGLFHLEIYHDPAAIPALQERLEKAGEEDAVDLRETIEDLKEPQQPTVVSDFDIWEFYPEESIPDFDVLSEKEIGEFLESPLASLREQAARSLFAGDFGLQTRSQLLGLALHDPELKVRASAWESFFEKTDDPELRETMLERLRNPETPDLERAGLAVGLADHSDQLDVHAAILEMAQKPETRDRALEAMWRSLDTTFGSEAVKYVNDPNPEVRRNVIWALGYLNRTGEASLLLDFIKDEEYRMDALHNYALIAPGSTTRKKIGKIFDEIEDLAGGFTEDEAMVVRSGLDVRLVRAGLKTVYEHGPAEPSKPEPVQAGSKIGRNDPCSCGSGKKYKKCCGQ